MRFSSILGFILFILTLILIFSPMAIVIDFPSLIVILGITIPVLLLSGLFKDFIKSFRLLTLSENPFSKIELKKMQASIKLTIKLLGFSGILAAFVGIIASLNGFTDMAILFSNLAISLIAPLYSLLFIIILLPIEAKIKAILSTLE